MGVRVEQGFIKLNRGKSGRMWTYVWITDIIMTMSACPKPNWKRPVRDENHDGYFYVPARWTTGSECVVDSYSVLSVRVSLNEMNAWVFYSVGWVQQIALPNVGEPCLSSWRPELDSEPAPSPERGNSCLPSRWTLVILLSSDPSWNTSSLGLKVVGCPGSEASSQTRLHCWLSQCLAYQPQIMGFASIIMLSQFLIINLYFSPPFAFLQIYRDTDG